LTATIAGSAPALAFDMSKLGYGSMFVGDFVPLINSSPKLCVTGKYVQCCPGGGAIP
jgi:hypothetical protein